MVGTDSYSVIECAQLINVLMIKYRIDCTLHIIGVSLEYTFPQVLKNFLFKWLNLTWSRVCIINWGYMNKVERNKRTLLAISPVADYSNIGKQNKSIIKLNEKRSGPTRHINREGPHHQEILSIIFGSLLGSAQMTQEKNGSRMKFCCAGGHGEYLIWLHSKLVELGYCKSSALVKRKVPYLISFDSFTLTSLN